MSDRLTQTGLENYLRATYNGGLITKGSNADLRMKPLLQKNFGETLDCSLTSVATVVNYLTGNDIGDDVIYNFVESVAKKYGYNGKTSGTNPLTIKKIFDASLKHFSIFKTSKQGYLKNICYNWEIIKRQIIAGNPVILSVYNDGRNYYKNHTVTIVGFEEYKVDNKNVRMLKVFDNWHLTFSYIDFNKLSLISSINYV